jgi:hypothetical protein
MFIFIFFFFQCFLCLVICLINKFYIFQIFLEIFSFFLFQNVLILKSCSIFVFLFISFFDVINEIDSIKKTCKMREMKVDWFWEIVFEISFTINDANDVLIDINILIYFVIFNFNLDEKILLVDEYISIVSFLDFCSFDSRTSISRVFLFKLVDRLLILLEELDRSITTSLFSVFLFFRVDFLVSRENL